MTTPTPPVRDPETRGLRLVTVLLALTVVSGLIDAVSFLGLGRVFTANVTGSVVILGFAAAGAPGFSVRHATLSLVCFLLGAVTGGRVAGRLGRGSRRRSTRLALAAEAALIGVAAAVAFAWPAGTAGTRAALICITAFAMGLRTATVRKLRVPDLITTTVVTMTLTGLASESRLGDATSHGTRRRGASVLAMAAGAYLGAWLVLHRGLGLPLLLAALVSGALAVVASGRE
ncbi:YoaK family protein [Streptomyces sp. NPDC004658]|uniref:YoaK family protein n=1 Tax=Streptomyces sp. NPDC004658 TaxID=3154672 RepID=UPI0033B7E6BE